MSSFFFLSLRNTVLFPILSEWISVVDLAVVDSAICSTEYRDGYLAAVSSEMFIHTGNMHLKSPQYYDWLDYRKIRVRNLNLSWFVTNRLDPSFVKYLAICRNINIEMQFCSNLLRILDSYKGVVNELDFNNCVDLNDEKFESVLPYITQVTKICLIETKCTDVTIERLIAHCPNLTNIEIYYCDHMSPSCFRQMSDAYCCQLKHFVPNEHIPNVDIAYALNKCTNLVSVGLSNMRLEMSCAVALSKCVLMTNLRTECCGVDDEFVCTMIADMSCLHFLGIDLSRITDVTLKKIGQCCPVFKQLSVEQCPEITDAGVIAMAKQCKHLERITLSYCPKLTEKALNALYKECKRLQTVLFEKNNTKTLGSLKTLIQHRGKELEALELVGDGLREKDDDEHIQYNVMLMDRKRSRRSTLVMQWDKGQFVSAPQLTQIFGLMPHLRYLSISRHAVTDKHLDHLMARCPLIDGLAFYDCSSISLVGLLKVIKHYSTKLIDFSFDDASKFMSNEVLVEIAPHLRSVACLTLMNLNYTVTDDGMIVLFDHCPHIKKLRLAVRSITNKSLVHALTLYGGQLTLLSIEGCMMLTKHLLREIPSLCQCLKHLNLVDCPGIRNHADCVMRLVQSYDKIDTILYGSQGNEVHYFKIL